jgi:hypothetical protein
VSTAAGNFKADKRIVKIPPEVEKECEEKEPEVEEK